MIFYYVEESPDTVMEILQKIHAVERDTDYNPIDTKVILFGEPIVKSPINPMMDDALGYISESDNEIEPLKAKTIVILDPDKSILLSTLRDNFTIIAEKPYISGSY